MDEPQMTSRLVPTRGVELPWTWTNTHTKEVRSGVVWITEDVLYRLAETTKDEAEQNGPSTYSSIGLSFAGEQALKPLGFIRTTTRGCPYGTDKLRAFLRRCEEQRTQSTSPK
jgi:hypothetical protein